MVGDDHSRGCEKGQEDRKDKTRSGRRIVYMGEWVEGTGGIMKSWIGGCRGKWKTLKKGHTGVVIVSHIINII